MANYLQQRRRGWYAVLDIPTDVRDRFDEKRKFVQSLKTESKTTASRRVGPLIAQWKQDIAKARQAPGDQVSDDVRFWREALAEAEGDDTADTLSLVLSDRAEAMEDKAEGTGVEFYRRVVGTLVDTGEHLDEWVATIRQKNTAKTVDMKRSDVLRLIEKFPTTEVITRKSVQRWVNDLTSDDGLKPKTVQRILSACRDYWSYLQALEVVSDELAPFHQLRTGAAKKGRAAKEAERRPFLPEEVVSLLRAAEKKGDRDLADLIGLAMWTGCRIEELCALRLDQVHADHLEVVDAKTAAGWREVPVHSRLRPTLSRLIEDSRDGYVLSGLSKNKYGDRSNAVGKRFGHLKVELGHGPQKVFHSIRRTVSTLLENAGVPENVSADILGHEKPTMTYGLYSGGSSLKQKAEALERIEYPAV